MRTHAHTFFFPQTTLTEVKKIQTDGGFLIKLLPLFQKLKKKRSEQEEHSKEGHETNLREIRQQQITADISFSQIQKTVQFISFLNTTSIQQFRWVSIQLYLKCQVISERPPLKSECDKQMSMRNKKGVVASEIGAIKQIAKMVGFPAFFAGGSEGSVFPAEAFFNGGGKGVIGRKSERIVITQRFDCQLALRQDATREPLVIVFGVLQGFDLQHQKFDLFLELCYFLLVALPNLAEDELHLLLLVLLFHQIAEIALTPLGFGFSGFGLGRFQLWVFAGRFGFGGEFCRWRFGDIELVFEVFDLVHIVMLHLFGDDIAFIECNFQFFVLLFQLCEVRVELKAVLKDIDLLLMDLFYFVIDFFEFEVVVFEVVDFIFQLVDVDVFLVDIVQHGEYL